ncbi:MAG: amidohydrolase family protein [Deltaproteobacteria bacterium]|nr:amidohydrolase family protein [Deltaproteobacteria bacterium]
MRENRKIIDAHSHLLPGEIITQASFYSEDWGKVERQLETMEKIGIDISILSYPTTDVSYNGQLTESQEAKLYNEAMSKIVKRYPDKFFWTALTPILDGKAGAELKRAKEELGAKGISLSSSYSGVYLDDERFFPLYESALDLKLPIFVHATTNKPIGYDSVEDPLLTPVIEFLFDLTICVGKLLMSGTLERFSELTFIFPHFGGVLPFLKERFDTTYTMLKRRGYVRDLGSLPSDHLKKIHVDVSGTTSPLTIECALELFDADHILWGSDYPSNTKASESLTGIEELTIPDSDKAAILGKNIEQILG